VRGFVYDMKTGGLTEVEPRELASPVARRNNAKLGRRFGMRILWKVVVVVLLVWSSLVTCVACFLVAFSIYWWPDMPTSPRPAEGRVYPLNDHAHYTYMNEWEHNLHEALWMAAPFLCLGMFLIHWFVDPFELKRRRRFGSPP